MIELSREYMTVGEAQQFAEREFIPLIHTRFLEKWSDAFINCNTIDQEEYKNSNPSMYTYYMKIINALYHIRAETPKYKRVINDDGTDTGYGYYVDMYNDFKATDDIAGWLMEYIPIQ